MEVEESISLLSPIRIRQEPIAFSPKFTTPTKQQIEGDEWKACYRLTDVIAAIDPISDRINLPFAIPREVRFKFCPSRFACLCSVTPYNWTNASISVPTQFSHTY